MLDFFAASDTVFSQVSNTAVGTHRVSTPALLDLLWLENRENGWGEKKTREGTGEKVNRVDARELHSTNCRISYLPKKSFVYPGVACES